MNLAVGRKTGQMNPGERRAVILVWGAPTAGLYLSNAHQTHRQMVYGDGSRGWV